MFCPKCGKDARNGATFCNHCGAAMPQITVPQPSDSGMAASAVPDVSKPARKTSAISSAAKKRIIIASVVAGVAVIGSCVGIGVYRDQTAAQRQMLSYLERGKYEQAAEYYQKHADEIKPEKLQVAIKNAIETIYDDYLEEEKSYGESLEFLSCFECYTMEGMAELVIQTEGQLHALSDSRSAYLQATQAESRSDYAEAIVLYRKVISDDPNYDTAQKQIDTCYALYTGNVLDRAKQYQSNRRYEDALELLKEASEVLGDDDQINTALNTCVSEYKALLFAKAEDYAEDGDYEEAAEYLLMYVESFPDGDDLQKKADQYIDQLMDNLLKEANELIKKGDYHNAILAIQDVKEDYPDSDRVHELEQSTMSTYLKQQLPLVDAAMEASDFLKAYTICKNAMEVMPDNNELLTRMETIDAKRPVLLSEVVVSEKDKNFYELTDLSETYHDTVGNTYHSGNLYFADTYYRDSPYATFYTGAQYQSVSGIIAVGRGTSSGTDGTLKIYGDGELLYSGGFDKTTVPQQIALDVSGITWLEFVATSDYDMEFLLADFAFTKLGA